MLAEEFLNPIGMSKYRLAKSTGVPAQRIGGSANFSACLTAGGCGCRPGMTR
jgi:plasmid maintenance system antidote protein VapI